MEDLVNTSFWRGRRVFITGHTGFKGAWLSLWLKSLGAEISGFSLDPPTSPSMFDVARVGEGIVDGRGDIRVLESVREALEAARPEVVFHLAAQSLVRASYSDPADTYLTNVMGTVHLLDAVRQHGTTVRAVVNVTSDKCYENREWAWGYREADALGGHDPYSNSKACAELVTAAYRSSFFTAHAGSQKRPPQIAAARAGNVIGGGDWAADRLIPDMIRAFTAKQAVVIRYPNAIRPWQHVLDPLGGYLRLAELLFDNENVAEAWNFGPLQDEARPVSWMVEQLVSAWGAGAEWRLDDAAQLHEAGMLRLDCSKARSRLGWSSRWSIDQSLRRVVEWHQAHLAGVDMRKFSLTQIADYCSAASS